jgi:dephospho-CoA kinase
MGQRILGLTGGIATGKSTVATYLTQRYGWPVLDADVYAREAVAPGSAILTAIAQRHGTALLNADGTLNRPGLGQIIFNNADEKRWVEQQIHPFVRRRFVEEMGKLADGAIAVHAIPLLFEANLTDQVSEIWVVTCPEAMQLARLMERDSLSPEAARVRIQNQWPLAEKVARADVVLDNGTTRDALYAQIAQAVSARHLHSFGQFA